MNTNNRFSSLLKNLMNTANLKNTVLAQELQYDVSYISKWINGQILPAEKGVEKILKGISRCIIHSLEDSGRAQLFSNYTVDNDQDLEGAIYDNLLIEYNYVKEMKVDTGSEVAPPLMYYPELTLIKFIEKMRHPILRSVQSLDVIAMLDLFAMEKYCQYAVADLQNNGMRGPRIKYPGVHFGVLLDMSGVMTNPIYNTILLLNMISNFTTLDFSLYESKQARGKAVFAVDNGYIISGMMTDNNHCIAVTTSEDQDICSMMYDKLRSYCTPNNRMLTQIDMAEFLKDNNYMRSILSDKHYYLLSYFPEHMMPEELFEMIVTEMEKDEPVELIDNIRKTFSLTQNILLETETNIILNDSAIHSLMVDGEISFYHKRIRLNVTQRLAFLKHILETHRKNSMMKIRLLGKESFASLQFIGNPNVFISQSMTHMRLPDVNENNVVNIVSSSSLEKLLNHTFREIWEMLGDEAEMKTEDNLQQGVRTMDILNRSINRNGNNAE